MYPTCWIFGQWQSRWIWSVLHFHLSESWSCVARFASAIRNLERTSDTLAVVICDEEDPCPVFTAYEPKSSFTTSPRQNTRPLCFGHFFSYSEFFRLHESISGARWTVFSFLCGCSIASFSLFILFSRYAGKLLNLSNPLSTTAFASSFFITWGIRMGLCARLCRVKELCPLAAKGSSWPWSPLSWMRHLCDSWASFLRS